MKFINGDFCFVTNSNRTTIVNMECWNEDKLLLVEEPKTCEYKFIISTPSICSKNYLQNLEKLNLRKHQKTHQNPFLVFLHTQQPRLPPLEFLLKF